MGPQATIDLYNEIIAQTPAKCDQDHIKTIIYSNPKIPDRTQAIVAQGESPLPYLMEGAKFLEKAGADFILIPCNTAHYYLAQFEKEIAVPILNMVELTVAYIMEQFPHIKKIGLLSTTGTLRTHIYQDSIEKQNLEVITSSQADQENLVMKAIYNIKANIKLEDAAQQLSQAAKNLAKQGAEVIIMGCTEIPLALKQEYISIPLIDPKKIIARKAVSLALA
jgi:aspartate racemase